MNEEMWQTLSGYIKYIKNMGFNVVNSCKEFADIIEAETNLLDVSNNGFVFVFKSVAKELSERTGKTYVEYLEEAKEMFLSGKTSAEVLYHYDLMLIERAGVDNK
jgi:hypothetical protein